MALPAPYNQYKYLGRFGANRHTAEYLLSALYQRSNHLNNKTPLPLPPIDGVVKTIPADIAFTFVINWCGENNILTSKESTFFQANIFKAPENILTRLFTAVQKRVIEPEHLLTSALVKNVAALEEAQKLRTVKASPKFDPSQAIKNYNQQLLSLDQIINQATPRFQSLVTPELTNSTDGKVSFKTLQTIFEDDFDNIAHTYQKAVIEYQNVADNQERAVLIGERVHHHLYNLTRSRHPSHVGFTLQANNPTDFTALAMLTGTIIENYEQEGGNLANLTSLKTNAAQAIPLLIPGQGEIYHTISIALNDPHAEKIAEEILRELNRSSKQEGITSQEIVRRAALKAGVTEADIPRILGIINNTGLEPAISYALSENTQTHLSLGGGLIENSLQKQGINPTLIADDIKSEFARLGITPSSNKDKDLRQQENFQTVTTKLEEARERGADASELDGLGRLLTNLAYDKVATRSERGNSSLIRTKNALTTFKQKIDDAERSFYDKWFHFEEKLPWSKALRTLAEYQEKFEHGFNHQVFKIADKLGLPRIPIFGFFGYTAEKWHNFKYTNSINILKSLRGTTTPWGKFAQFSVRHYIKGDLNFGGGLSSASREIVGKGYKWALNIAKKSRVGQKVGAWGAKAFAATLGKLGVQLGGKLASIALAAASVIGTVTAVIGLASLAIDFVIKPLIGFVKRFFSDEGFAAASVWIAGALASIATIPALISGGLASAIAGLGAALGGLAALFTTAILWAIGGLIVAGILYFTTVSFVPKLAPGNPQVISPAGATSGLEQDSPYIEVDKAVTGSFTGEKQIGNSNINQTLKYKVTVTAIDTALRDVKIKDVATKTTTQGSSPVGDPQDEVVANLLPGESYTFEYALKLDSSFRDSYLNNSVTVEASSDSGPQTEVKGQSITIGTAPVLPAGGFATRLAAAIASCYGTTVTIPDGGKCLENLNDPQIDSDVISILSASATKYVYLQCVGFIQAVMQGVTGGYPAAGNAGNYVITPPAGYTLFKGTPMPGDLFVQGYEIVSGTGHIGVVVGVAGNVITVADANKNAHGGTRTNAVLSLDKISGFLRKN